MLLQALVKKNAPLLGKSVSEVAFWDQYGVIVVGAELKHKGKKGKEEEEQQPEVTLGKKLLEPGTLLIFTARKLMFFTLKS